MHLHGYECGCELDMNKIIGWRCTTLTGLVNMGQMLSRGEEILTCSMLIQAVCTFPAKGRCRGTAPMWPRAPY